MQHLPLQDVGNAFDDYGIFVGFFSEFCKRGYIQMDTLLVFDPDWHIWTGRFGMEWEALENLIVRGGFDEFNYTFGLGYKFSLRLGKRKYFFQIDYALVYESQAELWNPLSFGFRGWL